MYSGTNHGFRIRDATESGAGFEQVFNSREKSGQPAAAGRHVRLSEIHL